MHSSIRITDSKLTPASDAEQQAGLLGWITCTLNGALRLDGLSLRQNTMGELTVSFPTRLDSRGDRHPYIAPIDERTRRGIEEQILECLRKKGRR